MSTQRISITTPSGTQSFNADAFPISIGLGKHAEVNLPLQGNPVILGHLILREEELLFEPSGVEEAIHSELRGGPPPEPAPEPEAAADSPPEDAPTESGEDAPPPPPKPAAPADYKHAQMLTSTSLHAGNYFTFRDHCRVDINRKGDEWALNIESKVVSGMRDVQRHAGPTRRRGIGLLGKLLLLILLLGLIIAGGVGWWLLSSKRVSMAFDPPVEQHELSGGLLRPKVADRYLLRKGTYHVRASLEGHHDIDTALVVSNPAEQVFSYTFRPLPGVITIETDPVSADAPVFINDTASGKAPLANHELELGDYTIAVKPSRYLHETTNLVVEGYGKAQTLRIPLTPRWADITITQPAGATVLADNKVVGETPLTFELFEGPHQLVLTKPLFRPYETSIEVVANQPMTLPPVTLIPSPGTVKIAAEPLGAKVMLDDTYKGDAPLDVEIDANEPHAIRVFKLGYESRSLNVRLGPEETTNVVVKLKPLTGVIRITVDPTDADLFINGSPRGRAEGSKVLPALVQTLELRREGYHPFSKSMTPTPGFEQVLKVALKPVRPAGTATPKAPQGNPEQYKTTAGPAFRRIRPGAYTMGSSRSSQGRRSNETQRPIVLKRHFYLGENEVTNREFRKFDAKHSAGDWGGQSLEGDTKPAVNVSWSAAAAYCNWLSTEEGLPPAYEKDGDSFSLIEPVGIGYRLPTEAEWEYVARYSAPGDTKKKYPWGAEFPPSKNSGNFAGSESSSIIANHMANYTDAFTTTAPVGTFPPNPLGIRDLGGNAAEWCSDGYQIHSSSSQPAIDPVSSGSGDLHVFRGSSWRDASVAYLRAMFRGYGSDAQPYIGFRVARYVE